MSLSDESTEKSNCTVSFSKVESEDSIWYFSFNCWTRWFICSFTDSRLSSDSSSSILAASSSGISYFLWDSAIMNYMRSLTRFISRTISIFLSRIFVSFSTMPLSSSRRTDAIFYPKASFLSSSEFANV